MSVPCTIVRSEKSKLKVVNSIWVIIEFEMAKTLHCGIYKSTAQKRGFDYEFSQYSEG